jgi:RNA polymerase sigma factor (sigma-70 family)
VSLRRGSGPEDIDVELGDLELGDAPPIAAGARKRVALETFAGNEEALRRTALRYSLCEDDADEALQRGLEILLHKAPSENARELIRWTQTVVKHEALAVREERERVLAGPAAQTPVPGREDWVAMLPTEVAGPHERAERDEAIERSREALATLKPQEVRTLGLLGEGYSYREIADITGFSARKVNRAIVEGRERFRHFLTRRDGGERCTELAPLLSAFADDEAEAADVATLREHLRTCPYCRSTLRAYRAAPGAAAALLPIVPPARGAVLGRLHDAYAAVATRVGGGSGTSDSTLGGLAAAGGTRGAGMTALAKVLALCAGTVGGAAACVATGVVPALPIDGPAPRQAPPPKVAVHHHPRHQKLAADLTAGPEYDVPPVVTPTEVIESMPEPQAQETQAPASAESGEGGEGGGEAPPPQKEEPRRDPEEAPIETAIAETPTSESGATEYVESPPAETYEAPSTSTATASTSAAPTSSSSGGGSGGSSGSSSGSAAGEFGP